MRYLGIDYGSKRIGVAISDENGRIAFPHTTILNDNQRNVLKKLSALCTAEHIKQIVLGLPISLNGKETKQTAQVRIFGHLLQSNITIPLVFENEMLTSRMASESGMKGSHIDTSSAAILLQSYLDKQTNT